MADEEIWEKRKQGKFCGCGQVFYTNSDGRERLPHVAGEYDSCLYDRNGKRRCCGTEENQWHSRPCTVNGPTGPIGCHPPFDEGEYLNEMYGQRRPMPYTPESEHQEFGPPFHIIETDSIPPGPMVVGEFTERGTGMVRALAGLDFGYRTCCSTYPGSPHWKGCGTYFFAEGQTVIKPDITWELGPGQVWPTTSRLRIKEDAGASDRTFENETRPL